MLTPKHQKLSDRIQKVRGCARSSSRVYASNLSRLQREHYPGKPLQDMKWLHSNSEKLLKKLKKNREYEHAAQHACCGTRRI